MEKCIKKADSQLYPLAAEIIKSTISNSDFNSYLPKNAPKWEIG